MAPPPKNRAEIEASESFASYRAGWKHAARGNRQDHRYTQHDKDHIVAAYVLGYTDADRALSDALHAAAKKYGIDLQKAVLR
jgi:hypothetical protein